MDWIYFERTDKCYKGFDIARNWRDARDSCEQRAEGGRLVSIPDEETQKFLKDEIVPQLPSSWAFWSGGYIDVDSGDWGWLGGTPWSSYQDWAFRHPKKVNTVRLLFVGNKNLGRMWVSKPMEEMHGFICQF